MRRCSPEDAVSAGEYARHTSAGPCATAPPAGTPESAAEQTANSAAVGNGRLGSGGRELVRSLWRAAWRFLETLRTERPWAPAPALLGMHLKTTKLQLEQACSPHVPCGIASSREMRGSACACADGGAGRAVYDYSSAARVRWCHPQPRGGVPTACVERLKSEPRPQDLAYLWNLEEQNRLNSRARTDR